MASWFSYFFNNENPRDKILIGDNRLVGNALLEKQRFPVGVAFYSAANIATIKGLVMKDREEKSAQFIDNFLIQKTMEAAYLRMIGQEERKVDKDELSKLVEMLNSEVVFNLNLSVNRKEQKAADYLAFLRQPNPAATSRRSLPAGVNHISDKTIVSTRNW